MKKGVELALNTMIIAIILLIVAAIIIAIFVGGVRNLVPWFNQATSCTGQGNTCKLPDQCTGGVIQGDCKAPDVCCLREGNAKT